MKISIFGLGRVGAVAAACLASRGHTIIGIDRSEDIRSLVAVGKSPIVEPGLDELLRDAVENGRLIVGTDSGEAVRATDFSLICVGTPRGTDGAFDAEALRLVCRAIGGGIRANGHRVIVRSTVLPGTTREVVIPILEEASGLRAGKDFAVVAAPEFLREGTAIDDFFNPSQIVVGADDPGVASRVAALIGGAGAASLTSIEAAEMVKYVSNVWHGLKVAFANEIDTLCKALMMDGGEVMRVFSQDLKLNLSDQYLRPGSAFGGPCLAKDIEALCHRADQLDLGLPLISSILPSNEKRLTTQLQLLLSTGKRTVSFLGVSYKAETDDTRSSPYLELCRRLVARDCDLRIFDPLVSKSAASGRANDQWPGSTPLPAALFVDTLEKALLHGDLIVIGARHRTFANVRRSLSPTQSLIDLARGTVER